MATKKGKAARKLRAGVIGYGGAFNMGRAHFNLMQDAGMVPAAVAEPDGERRKAADVDFPGIATFASAREMLAKADVDVVAIITPHNTHAKLALECLRSGRHVVCEKPLAIATAECDAMIAEAKKKKLVLSTYHNRHWDGCVMRAVETVRSGVLGEVVRVEAHMGGFSKPGDWWRGSKSISGGILYDWGVHLLEYMFQIVDDEMTEVSGFAHTGFWAKKTKWGKDTVEDEGQCVVRFKRGAWGTLTISHLDHNAKRGQIEILGTKGSYIFDHKTYELVAVGEDGVTAVTKGANPANRYECFYRNVAGHILKGQKLVITPEWSRRPIHVLDLAGRSAKAGKTLPTKYK